MNNNDNKMDERDYIEDASYMEYKAKVYKTKRIYEIVVALLLIIGISLIIAGIVFHLLNNGISFILFVIGFALVLLSGFYIGMARVMYDDDVLYNRYKKKKK